MARLPAVNQPAPETEADGRRRRTLRTREAIVAALMALVDEGQPAPTAAQVAARAGVALRSIGQHFPSRESLFAAAAAVHARRAEAERVEIDAKAPLAQRLRALVTARSRALEASAALRRAVTLLEPGSPAVAEAARAQARRRRAEVAAVFTPELDGCGGAAARKRLLDLLDLAASGRTWDGLRRDQGLGQRQAREAMARMIGALLQ